MPARQFQPAKKSDGAPEVLHMTPAAAAAFTIGAPLARDGTNPNRVVVHAGGATVTGIIGVAGAGAEAGLPDAQGDRPFGTTIPVYKANRDVEFFGQVTDGANPVVVAGDGSLEGNQYGIVANSNIWTVDIADEMDVVLTVTREVPELNGVMFKFLASAIAD